MSKSNWTITTNKAEFVSINNGLIHVEAGKDSPELAQIIIDCLNVHARTGDLVKLETEALRNEMNFMALANELGPEKTVKVLKNHKKKIQLLNQIENL